MLFRSRQERDAEANLSTEEDTQKAQARFSGTHGDPWRAVSFEAKAAQGTPADCGLS